MTLVKICGVSDPKHARAAAACGADFIGMVFAPSRRQVTLGDAKRIAAGLRQEHREIPAGVRGIEEALRNQRPLLVGVFADQDADTINGIAEDVGLDMVQLSGSESWEMCASINFPLFKCLKVRDTESADDLMVHVRDGAIVLLDPFVEGAYGGTGKTLDWTVAARMAEQIPIVLAGGLTPDNVAKAVKMVHPWAVDVSSGIEEEGSKDTAKIRAFIEAAKGKQG